IQAKYPAHQNELGRTRNNLANGLKELSRRTDGDDGERQIDEAIELLQQSVAELERLPDPTNPIIAQANLAHALTLRAARQPGLTRIADIERARELFARIDASLDKNKNPRVWANAKQNEAELLRLVGQRLTDSAESFRALKASFELYQQVLTVISRETAPNDWATVCA